MLPWSARSSAPKNSNGVETHSTTHMVRGWRTMLRGQPRRDHPNHHDVLFTDVATINVSCFAVAFLGTPGFRPTWRCFHWSSALLGCLLCLGLMFAIWLYSLGALAFGAGVGFYVRSRSVSTDWGDAGAGFRFQVARDQLALTERSTFHHAKNWRPQILVLCRS